MQRAELRSQRDEVQNSVFERQDQGRIKKNLESSEITQVSGQEGKVRPGGGGSCGLRGC